MSTRELVYPVCHVEDDGQTDGLRFRFTIPGSKFGPVEVVLEVEQWRQLSAAVDALTERVTDGY